MVPAVKELFIQIYPLKGRLQPADVDRRIS